MKYKNNIIYYILKEYEREEKNQNINTSLVSKYDLYSQNLESLKSVCAKFKINKSEKLDILITDLEKEILSKEKFDEKKAKMIGSVVAFVGTPLLPLLFNYFKADVNLMILAMLLLVEVIILFYAVYLIVDEINSHFSLRAQYKKLLKMLRDIKLLNCSEEKKIDEE